MIANGQSVVYVAHALGISEALIHKWKQPNRKEEKQRLPGPVSHTLLENQRLQQRVSQLETERDILKKARRAAPLSIISQQT